jgi:AcrR family transcriptional regulator
MMDKTNSRDSRPPSEWPLELSPVATKRQSTKSLLIDTGEKLFGQHGFDGISLREIAAAAGQANSNVVQYHFTSKNGLIKAIAEDRLGRIEVLRRDRLADLKSGKYHHDPRELLKILWLPLLLLKDEEGNHTFCRFLLQQMIQPRTSSYPLFTHLYSSSVTGNRRIDPCVVQATKLLRAHYQQVGRSTFARRLTALSIMFLASVIEHDYARRSGNWPVPAKFDAKPILDMAIGALSVPE